MSYYLLLYRTVPDYLEARGPHRKAHFKHAQEAVDHGDLLLGGAYADPADGAALVFHCADRELVELFAVQDPYVINEVVTHWEVREWTVVLGKDFAG